LVAVGDSVVTGSFSFMAGASVFGARVGRGFTSVGGFFSVGFLLGDSSGVGC
jgi:hypothetical protein